MSRKPKGLTRRTFLKDVVAAGAGLTALSTATAAQQAAKKSQEGRPTGEASTKRPNILLVMSDQHAPQASGFLGHPIVRTPNMDKLAARGVVFERAVCNSPVCAPSRMSFLSGRYVHKVGAWDNESPLSDRVPTFAHYLGVAGYETILTGKMHFKGHNVSHGFEKRLTPDFGSSAFGLSEMLTPEFKEIAPEHSMIADLEDSGAGRTSVMVHDEMVRDTVVDYLRKYAASNRERPFMVCASPFAPHFPYIVPQEYFGMYYPDNVDLPNIPEGHLDKLHPAVELQRRAKQFQKIDPRGEVVRRTRAAYYGLVTYTDAILGSMMDALQETGLADDTVVIYTSDHGEFAGEHGMWGKDSFYEWSVRVPLIISWPKRFPQGKKLRQNCSLVDIMPTLLELAGVENAHDLDGHSLLPLMDGRGEWKDECFSEFESDTVAGPISMLCQGDLKYNHFPYYGQDELFDLSRDPGEFQNLINHPDYQDASRRILEQIKSFWNYDALQAERMLARQDRYVVARATKAAKNHDKYYLPPKSFIEEFGKPWNKRL